MRHAVAVAVLAVACQSGSSSPSGGSGQPPPSAAAPSAPPAAAGEPKVIPGATVVATLTTDEAQDLCDAYQRSGAATDSVENRDYLIANWLSKSIRSETGHAWLINFARLGSDKAARVDALTRAAKGAGLTSCPLIEMWQ